MTEKKTNPMKRGRKPRPPAELRRAYVTVRCRDELYDATLAACKGARDAIEGKTAPAAIMTPNVPAPPTRLPKRLADSLARFTGKT